MQSIDSTEKYAYRMSKDLVSEKEYITKENIKKNIIQIGHKFLIIHTKY